MTTTTRDLNMPVEQVEPDKKDSKKGDKPKVVVRTYAGKGGRK